MDAATVALSIAAGAVAGAAAAWVVSGFRLRRIAELESLLAAALKGEAGQRALVKASKLVLRRPRRRYIVFEVVPARVGREEVERAIEDTARSVLGLVGLADSALKLVEFNEATGRGVLRVRHTHKYVALAVLGLVRRAGGRQVMLVPLATTGSIRRAKMLASTS